MLRTNSYIFGNKSVGFLTLVVILGFYIIINNWAFEVTDALKQLEVTDPVLSIRPNRGPNLSRRKDALSYAFICFQHCYVCYNKGEKGKIGR